MIRPKSPPVHVLMKPRTHRLNAHRTLEYYTPEDVQKLVDELGDHVDRVVAVPVVNQADLTPSGQAICTCPSGDGSLRWPCPKHPPAAAKDDRTAIRLLVAAGFITEEKANEALCIAHGFSAGPLQAPPAAVPAEQARGGNDD